MKRLFAIISNILMVFFLVFVFKTISDTYVSHYYPNVSVLSSKPDTSSQKVFEKLTQLAQETNSFIAVQFQSLGEDGQTEFSYQVFGEGKLPQGLKNNTSNQLLQEVRNNYFIFNGSLSIDTLKEELDKLGLLKTYAMKPNILTYTNFLFGSASTSTSLFISVLCFIALSIIAQIKVLKRAGIRLIAGEKRWKIFTRTFLIDLKHLLVGLIAGLIALFSLSVSLSFVPVIMYMIAINLLLYNIILLVVSFVFCAIFAIGIKKINLMQIIKGQTPVKGIITLVLVGQFLVFPLIAFGASSGLRFLQGFIQFEKSTQYWYSEDELVQLNISREGFDVSVAIDEDYKVDKWMSFIQEAAEEQDLILSKHNVGIEDIISPLGDSNKWKSYNIEGNVIIVTPGYLKRQNIVVSNDKIYNLQKGEFSLLLPERLKNEEQHYASLYEKEISQMILGTETGKQTIKAIIDYLPNNQERFIYNTTPFAYKQFLIDPIIVVISPHSTSSHSKGFWMNAVQGDLLFEDVSKIQQLLKKHDMSSFVSSIISVYQIHKEIAEKIRTQILISLAGAVLGIATSILMFNTMNLLYFEEFRRDILIKRISGFTFLELHRSYLLAQLVTCILGFVASICLSADIFTSLFTFVLFSANSVGLLYLQMTRENKSSITILKGA